MSNLQETPVWVVGIYQLTEETPVLGKENGVPGDGPANLQAQQLANRTQYLKEKIESAIDYREYTFYKSESDPDGTIGGMAATTEGQAFRVSQGPDGEDSFKYYLHKNGIAVLDARYPGTAAIENLLPLNQKTKFLASGEDNFPFAESFDRIGFDSNQDVVFQWKGKVFTTYLNWKFPFVGTKELNLNGMAVSDRNILEEGDKENIEILSQVRLFEAMKPEGYPFAESFDYIAKDSMANMMWALRGNVYFNYMSCVYSEIDVAKLSVNGVSLDVNAILPTEDAQNLTRLSNASQFQDSSAFPFNPTAWTVFDKNRDVIFRVEDYWKALENIKALQDELAQLSPQANPLLPFADVTSGYSQIFAYNSETGDQVQVTNGESNETAPRPDGADHIVWQSDRADPPPGALFYAQLPDFTPHAYIARKKIVGWGHSFINNGAFLNRLHALTGLPTYNFGLSGQTSDAIAARQGGAPTYYAPVGGVIPESGAVTLTPAVPGPCRSLAAPVNLSCRLAGVDGTFAWDGTNAKFTRQSPGDAVAVAVLVPLYVYPITTVNVSGSIPAGTLYEEHDECMNLIWPGRNNLNQTDLIMENVDSIVKNLKNIGQKFLLLAEFNSSAEPTGSTGFNQMTELNHRYQDKYPDFYCAIGNVDIRQNFINNANPASAGDMEDVAVGLTPRSLRYDPLHPSQQISGNGGSLTPELALDYGANVNATFTRDVFNNKGWL